MELPSPLKILYRHWSHHVQQEKPRPKTSLKLIDEKLLAALKWFIAERISIWKMKVTGGAPPYTDDPILGHFRFCNIFREFDRQTIEFHTLLNPLRDEFPLWLLNMFYCRMVARPETIRQAGLLSFNNTQNKKVYEALRSVPRPRFGTPYVFPISAILRSPTPSRELFITQYLPKAIPRVVDEIAEWEKQPVYEGVESILPVFGYSLSFLWTEVLIDAAYHFPERIDLFGRFPIGPGATPTIERMATGKDPSILVAELCSIPIDTGITFNNQPLTLSAENWEGIACEFRKYTNLRSGKGRRRIYPSAQQHPRS